MRSHKRSWGLGPIREYVLTRIHGLCRSGPRERVGLAVIMDMVLVQLTNIAMWASCHAVARKRLRNTHRTPSAIFLPPTTLVLVDALPASRSYKPQTTAKSSTMADNSIFNSSEVQDVSVSPSDQDRTTEGGSYYCVVA
jgi:hypothetical protein